jgi:lysophospholipase L1-like esterase
MRKMALLGVLLIACVVGATAIFLSGYEFHKWRHPPSREHFEAREQAILAHTRQNPTADFAIIGDSITEFAYLPSLCGRPVLNAGISGVTVSDAKELMALLSPVLKARTIVLAVGVNDAGTWTHQTGVVEEEYEQLVRLAQSSGAQVFAATVGPVTMRATAAYNLSRIAAINAQIKSVAARTRAMLIDLGAQLHADETTDGVHPNEAGNRRWRDLIEAAVCHR